jgi:hypothetical protein
VRMGAEADKAQRTTCNTQQQGRTHGDIMGGS